MDTLDGGGPEIGLRDYKPRLTSQSTPLGSLPETGWRCPDEITMSYPSMPRASLHARLGPDA
jgi:hypothetical protein